jgi:hypothetical protein
MALSMANHKLLLKHWGLRLVDEFPFSYNELAIINKGQKLLEAL